MKNLNEVQVHKLYHWKSITCFNISAHIEPLDIWRISNEIVGNKIFGGGRKYQAIYGLILREEGERRCRRAWRVIECKITNRETRKQKLRRGKRNNKGKQLKKNKEKWKRECECYVGDDTQRRESKLKKEETSMMMELRASWTSGESKEIKVIEKETGEKMLGQDGVARGE